MTQRFDVVGIGGGYVAGVTLMGVNPGSFIDGMVTSVTNHDINLTKTKTITTGTNDFEKGITIRGPR